MANYTVELERFNHDKEILREAIVKDERINKEEDRCWDMVISICNLRTKGMRRLQNYLTETYPQRIAKIHKIPCCGKTPSTGQIEMYLDIADEMFALTV